MQTLTSLFEQDCFGLSEADKREVFTGVMRELNGWHYQNCHQYRQLINAQGGVPDNQTLESMLALSARLFKEFDLVSVPASEIVKHLYSSGTTSQAVSKICLDRHTASLQSKTLVRILQSFVGHQRLPMLIIDNPDIVQNRRRFSARAAGIQGLSLFGRDHTWLLDKNMRPDMDSYHRFCQQYSGQPVLVVGFTFIIWEYFLRVLEEQPVGQPNSSLLPQGILLHSGGWKKLQEKAVDNTAFKAVVRNLTGITRVHNFYGMVEQTGSIFVECEKGYLHASLYSVVIIRHPVTLLPQNDGESGVIQVMSLLPVSYPGHNLLTEDIGVKLGTDNCACQRKGDYFQVLGRLKRSENRGCSDTISG